MVVSGSVTRLRNTIVANSTARPIAAVRRPRRAQSRQRRELCLRTRQPPGRPSGRPVDRQRRPDVDPRPPDRQPGHRRGRQRRLFERRPAGAAPPARRGWRRRRDLRHRVVRGPDLSRASLRPAPAGPGRRRARRSRTLVASITATTPPVSSTNRLRALRFGRVTNATVDVAGQTGIGGGQSVTLPDGPLQTSMIVHRGPNGDAATVELVVVDDCGDWPTLVGGGRDAWGGAERRRRRPGDDRRADTGAAGSVVPSPVAACTPRPPIGVSSEAYRPRSAPGDGYRRTGRPGPGWCSAPWPTPRWTWTGRSALPAAPWCCSRCPGAGTLIVRRLDAQRPVTVPLTITDACGAWQTFIGGGRDVWDGVSTR